MQFFNNFNIVVLLSLGLASQFLQVQSQDPQPDQPSAPSTFKCNQDADKTYGFCIGSKPGSETDITIVMPKSYKTEQDQPATFDCTGQQIGGQDTKSTACCSLGYGLKSPGETQDISTTDLSSHCKTNNSA